MLQFGDGLRGRRSDEVPRMLRSALLKEGVPSQQVEMVPDEQEAVTQAMRMARPGDLVLWDNRSVMHRRDAFDESLRRRMHRTQIVGEPVLAG